MTRQSDLDINRNVRKLLVRHWIDLGRLSIRCFDGILSIHGTLQRIPGMHEELTSPIVEAMFAQIKRTPNVRRIAVNIENWTNDSGKWQPISKALLKKRELGMSKTQPQTRRWQVK